MKKWLWVVLLQVSLNAYEVPWEEYKTETILPLAQKQIEGWCSPEKGEKMMDLIYETHPKICVEIGVFAGASILPTARALKYLGSGIVYAIDPWLEEEAVKGYSADNPNYDWWKHRSQLTRMFFLFYTMLKNYSLCDYCAIYPFTSAKAAQWFVDGSIDILHIDGNHSEQIALEDVKMYLPKVKKGGYIWFDDVDWNSTKPAIQHLTQFCTHLPQGSAGHCHLYQKRGD